MAGASFASHERGPAVASRQTPPREPSPRSHAPPGPAYEFGGAMPVGVLRRKCSACAAEDERLVRREPNGATPGVDAPQQLSGYLHASAGSGRPLEPSVRADFERGFGSSLAAVRVLSDEPAAHAAASLGARAFTLGSSIWFGRGEYRPDTAGGRRLLAHELAHTLQQQSGSSGIQTQLRVGAVSDPAEAEADRAAEAALRGEPSVLSQHGPAIRRTCTASPGRHADERRMSCSSGEYWLTRTVETTPSARQPATRFEVDVQYGSGTVRVPVRVCRGGTELLVEPRLGDLPEAAAQVLSNAVARRALESGVTLTPGLTIRVRQSRSFDITLQGAPTIAMSNGSVTQVDVSISVRVHNRFEGRIGYQYTPGVGGLPDTHGVVVSVPFPWETQQRPQIPAIDCSETPPATTRYRYTCERIIPGTPAQPPVMRSGRTVIHALFRYKTATIVGWVFEGDTEIPHDEAAIGARLTALAGQDFRLQSVEGMTSPEGPVGRGPNFEGNQSLSEQRARAANQLVARLCASCGTATRVVGIGETYPQFVAQRGRQLSTSTSDAFLSGQPTPDPLRPADPDAFRRDNQANLGEAVYHRLRRASLVFERDPVARAAVPAGPETTRSVTCDAELLGAAPTAFGSTASAPTR